MFYTVYRDDFSTLSFDQIVKIYHWQIIYKTIDLKHETIIRTYYMLKLQL